MNRAAQVGFMATETQQMVASATPPVPAFVEVYEAHVRFVWRTLRRLGVPDKDCDDATQDVFLVVHRRLHEFRPDAPLEHWLFRITSRIARDHRRSGRRKSPAEHGLVAVDSADVEDAAQGSPVDAAERSAAARLIRDLLQELDEPKREVFILAELEQLTAPEIAQALELPLNTVYSRLRRARLEFEAALERHRAHAKGESP